MKLTIVNVLLASGLVICAQQAAAQSYSIDWHTIGGGSGTSTGGVFAVSGTSGQHDADAGPMTGGNFSLTGGFWSLFVVQTSDAPPLSIERQGAAFRVFWPMSGSGFVLDESLTATGAWSQVAFPYVTNVNGVSLTAPVPTGNRFFRLRRP